MYTTITVIVILVLLVVLFYPMFRCRPVKVKNCYTCRHINTEETLDCITHMKRCPQWDWDGERMCTPERQN